MTLDIGMKGMVDGVKGVSVWGVGDGVKINTVSAMGPP